MAAETVGPMKMKVFKGLCGYLKKRFTNSCFRLCILHVTCNGFWVVEKLSTMLPSLSQKTQDMIANTGIFKKIKICLETRVRLAWIQ